jgi:hypothetical protein
VLVLLGSEGDAVKAYDEALRLRPDYAEACDRTRSFTQSHSAVITRSPLPSISLLVAQFSLNSDLTTRSAIALSEMIHNLELGS